jgi:hypothetical protein
MKKFFIFLLLLCWFACFSQSDTTTGNGQEKRKLILADSMTIKLQMMKDSVAAAIKIADRNVIREDFSSNIGSLMQLQKEQKARQKRAAIIRIAIGVGLLAVLIIGLRRKRK